MIFSESLKKNQDFQRVYRAADSRANRYLVLYRLENGLSKNRIGISVSKKVGNSVVRHHMCRLIRESYRLNEKSLKPGYDLVVVVRPLAKSRSYREIESALLHLMKLQNLVQELSSENKEYQMSVLSHLFPVWAGSDREIRRSEGFPSGRVAYLKVQSLFSRRV